MATTISLTGVTTTRATRQVIALLAEAGLNPHYGPDGAEIYEGTVKVLFDQGTRSGVFGAILIGAETGQITRGEIWYGNHSDRQLITGCADIRRHVTSLLALKHAVA